MVIEILTFIALATALGGDGGDTLHRSSRATTNRIAVLAEPSLPATGCPSSPDSIVKILSDLKIDVDKISVSDMADPTVFSPDRYAVVVIPTGESFPGAAARENLIRFLRNGGDLVTTGGYAFNHLVRKVNDQWVSESDWIRKSLEERKRNSKSLIVDPGFEATDDPPIGSPPLQDNLPATWYRTDAHCRLTNDVVHDGQRSARIAIPFGDQATSGGYATAVSVCPGHTYYVSGHLRATNLSGPGIAYMAVYQYDAQGQMVEFLDFGVVREDSDWRRFEYNFTVQKNVTTARLQCGFYRKQGTAWFDRFQFIDVTGLQFKPMNTSSGRPQDGLVVDSDQLGIFDASFPLERVRQLRTAADQFVVNSDVRWESAFTGWGASGVLNYDHARWIPLVESFDRYGRPRGAAAAMLINYGGHFAGSNWAYFGIDNVDLFADSASPMSEILRQTVQFLLRETYLRNIETNHRLYHDGEEIDTSVTIDNHGRHDRQPTVTFELEDRSGKTVAKQTEDAGKIPPGEKKTVVANLGRLPIDHTDSLFRVKATLNLDGKPIDQMVTGVVQDSPSALKAGPELRFVDNYFQLNNRPMFLFGTDTYSRTYMSAAENPWTWNEELSAARDIGLNIYENLQYSRPDCQMQDDDWRSFKALAQLTQRHQLVFMPGILIGQNTAINTDLLARQSKLCREYASHLGSTPGLLYYLNGDYQLQTEQHADAMKQDWIEWLRSRYGSIAKLRSAWTTPSLTANWDDIPFPPPNSGRWDDVPTLDLSRFRISLTTRWNRSHVAAIREVDHLHATTSEYYSQPSDGIDLPMTIDSQDVSNIGFFDLPQKDLEVLPLRICFNDLRARGKGVSLGEYGVKTHPAWEESNGATGYHLRRSEQEQLQLFSAVAHYGLGLGCCKIQNWCLRDAQTRVFPWGVFYPNQLIPKKVAYLHRNQSMIWRFLTPTYKTPPLTVCLANHLRMGNEASVGAQVAQRTFADLLALHLPFNCIDDGHLSEMPESTRVIFYPSPMTITDDTFDGLAKWVRAGGTLFVTGDVSFNENRQRTRQERVSVLAGVEVLSEMFPHVARYAADPTTTEFSFETPVRGTTKPCIAVRAERAQVLATTENGAPVMVRNRLGKGTIFFCFDPLELEASNETTSLRRKVYREVARECGLAPLPVTPDESWIHIMKQPTKQGDVHVVFNLLDGDNVAPISIPTAAGDVTLQVRGRWPGLAATTRSGKLVIAATHGGATVDGDSVMGGPGHKAALSLDQSDLRQSKAILVAPLETGDLILKERADLNVALIGEFSHGRWVEFERLELTGGSINIPIDEDRATALILLCRRAEDKQWVDQLQKAINHPSQIDGY